MGEVCVHSDGQTRPPPPGPPDERLIAELATGQHGVISRGQLRELGYGRGAIDRRVAQRRLHPLHRGVYAVGHRVLPARGRWMAAVLAYGDGAVLSHRAAAELWELLPVGAGRIDVTVPERRGGARAGLVLHRARALDDRDRTLRDDIPVTAVPRTLLDLAEVLDARRLERALEQAERLRLFDLRAVRELLARSPGRHGLTPLHALLESTAAPAETRSHLERRFLDLCDEAGLPMPVVNAVVAGYQVDALWPRRRLVVELDGYAYHRSRRAFEADRIRDAQLKLCGHDVVRLTARRLDSDPVGVVATLRALLGRGDAL